VSDQPPSGPDWTPPQPPPPEGPGSWPPPPPPQPPPTQQQPPTQQWGPPPPGYQPYGQYGQPYGGAYAPRRTEGNAIAALVCAIASFVICPLIPAVVALFLASAAKRNIQASNGALDGESLVTAARIIAWINVGLCVLGTIAIILAIVIAAAGSSSSSVGMLAQPVL
jgi:hypothetical protein